MSHMIYIITHMHPMPTKSQRIIEVIMDSDFYAGVFTGENLDCEA